VELSDYNTTIHSTLGQLFDYKQINNKIDVSGLPRGVYFITISSKENVTLKRLKFVKE
jgi:hypothetical protein